MCYQFARAGLGRQARKRDPEETQRRILDAAERAFALRGFGGARLRYIAQEAGVHTRSCIPTMATNRDCSPR